MSAKVWSSSAAVAVACLCSRHAATSAFSPPLSSPLAPVPRTWSPPCSPSHTSSRRRPRSRTFSGIYSNKNDNVDLIEYLLGDNDAAGDDDPYSRYTHQIAIPLHDASELHSALTAIQTSLVRDCPRLIRACVVPALLRMPLLYVDARPLQRGSVLGGGDANVDAVLERVVQGAVREVVYGENVKMVEPILLPFRGLELQGEDNSVLYAVGNNVNDENQEKKKTDSKNGVEEDDGVYVVDDWAAAEPKGPSGWEVLERLVHNIQNELEKSHGLHTCWPSDKPQGEAIEDDDPIIAAVKRKQRKWRPRVPFVRLPKDFYWDLQEDQEKRNGKSSGDDEDEYDDLPSFVDTGFDGISPLFWYETWGEEDILEPPGVRMRSVAVYRRMVPGGGEAESSFYIPTSSDMPRAWDGGMGAGDEEKGGNGVELPVGDAKLASRERRESAKAMERLNEVERRAEREWEEGKARWMEEMDDPSKNYGGDDLLDDDLFAPFNVGMEVGDVTVEGDAAYSTPWGESDAEEGSVAGSEREEEGSLDEPIVSLHDEPVIEKEQSQSYSPETPQQIESKPRRELPSIEDNPVFQRLWKGEKQVTSKGQNTAVALDGTPPTEDVPLPPYPSDAHFVGAWRVVSSPLGTESASIEDTESNSSDNFILRVDGQVMGGPVLDAQYQHKAAGGEWKMFQAVRKSDGSSSAPPATLTRLRIRLLVPPEKEKALVMEGEVTRLVMPGTGDVTSSSSDGWMMAGGGGMLDGMLQNLDDGQSKPGGTGEGFLYCGGEAWTEDVNGGANRRKLGPFSLMKLKAIDRKNLIYTVDVSRPNAKEDEEDED